MTKPIGDINKRFSVYVFNKYVYSARSRNIQFDLSREQVFILSQQPCFYCKRLGGNVYVRPQDGNEVRYNGIDRMDNNKGYTLDNCAPCCFRCNYGKMDDSLFDFLLHVKRIAEHSNVPN